MIGILLTVLIVFPFDRKFLTQEQYLYQQIERFLAVRISDKPSLNMTIKPENGEEVIYLVRQ